MRWWLLVAATPRSTPRLQIDDVGERVYAYFQPRALSISVISKRFTGLPRSPSFLRGSVCRLHFRGASRARAERPLCQLSRSLYRSILFHESNNSERYGYSKSVSRVADGINPAIPAKLNISLLQIVAGDVSYEIAIEDFHDLGLKAFRCF